MVRTVPRLSALVGLLFLASCGDSPTEFLQDGGGEQLSAPNLATFSEGAGGDDAQAGGGAQVWTDKDDYSPGETVTILGSGWWTGETVHIHITEDPQNHPDHNYYVEADDDGNFVHAELVMDDDHFGVTFYLTALGLESGLSATWVFTDGFVQARTNSLNSSNVTITLGWRFFSGNSECTGDPSEVDSAIVAQAATNIKTVNSGQSIELTAPETVSGQEFVSWTRGETTVTDRTICVVGQTAAQNWTANYQLPVATNTPPEVTVDEDPVEVDEGELATNTGTWSDADGDEVTLTASIGSVTKNADGTWDWQFQTTDGPAESETVTITAEDEHGAKASVDFDLIVNNVPPTVQVTAPVHLDGQFEVNTAVSLSANFTDPGVHDAPWECEIDWGDGSDQEDGDVDVTGSGTGTCTGSRVYEAAGIYTITVKVTDKDGGEGTDQVSIVVFDPSAGFVTGGGWIDSPQGAYKDDQYLVGRANFGFVSQYQRRGTNLVLTGNTQFVFQAAGLNFHSDHYDWLVVTGQSRAMFKGDGRVNGVSGHEFIVSVVEGKAGEGKFRIKISKGEDVIYDNHEIEDAEIDAEPTTVIQGGSIVIHTGGNGRNR